MTARHSSLFTLRPGQSGLEIYTSQRDAATFPKKDIRYKEELQRMKKEESINVSAFIVSAIKGELGSL